MQHFLKVFFDIVLWRRGPQDLPSSRLLLALTALAYVCVSALQLAMLGESGPEWFVFLVVDPILLTGGTWLLLKLFGHTERFLQTATAVLGTGALLGLLLFLPLQLILSGIGAGQDSTAAGIFALMLVIVFALVTGRILQLATESNLFTGIALALTYFMLINLLLGVANGGGG